MQFLQLLTYSPWSSSELKSCITKSFRLWLWFVMVNVARALTVTWQVVLQAKRTSVLKEDLSRKTWSLKKKWEHVKSFTMATTWVIQSLEVIRTDVAPPCCTDHRSQPQFPLPVIWCECETNQQLPHFLFLHSSSWHPERYSNTGKASSEQCCPKDTAKVPGHMRNLLLRRILPHWESVGVCNNNLCTHCFLGETHQDGILDKQQNSQGSWTHAISYPWKMNGHSEATGN